MNSRASAVADFVLCPPRPAVTITNPQVELLCAATPTLQFHPGRCLLAVVSSSGQSHCNQFMLGLRMVLRCWVSVHQQGKVKASVDGSLGLLEHDQGRNSHGHTLTVEILISTNKARRLCIYIDMEVLTSTNPETK